MTATVPVGNEPQSVAVSPDGSRAYVAGGDGTVWVINTTTNTTIGDPIRIIGDPIRINSSGPYGVAVSPDGSRLYVTKAGDGTLSVIDTITTTTIGDPIPVGYGPKGVAVSPDGSRLYIIHQDAYAARAGTVSVIDTVTRTAVGDPILVGVNPRAVAVSPDGSRVYVADQEGSSGYFHGTVSVINTATNEVVATIPVGWSPCGVAVSPDGSILYVRHANTTQDGGVVSVIDTATNTTIGDLIDVSYSGGLAVSPDGRRLYVTNSNDNTVSVIDTGVTGGGGGGGTSDVARLPLNMYKGYEPEINVSVGGGPSIPVIVDTGSKGLVVPLQAVSSQLWGALGLSLLNRNNFVTGAYTGSGGNDEWYWGVKVPTTVTIGDASTGQVVTGQTYVIVALRTGTPPQTWWERLLQLPHKSVSLHDSFLAASGGADGVLGIGPNAPGKGPLVTAALPGHLSDGEFISVNTANENSAGSYVAFGAPGDLDLGGASSLGAPITTVQIRIDGGAPQTVQATFDSGGLYGTIPSSLVPKILQLNSKKQLPAGTTIAVYNTNGDLLYSYTTNAVDGPTVTSDAMMNTGIIPFGTAGYGNFTGIYIDNTASAGTLIAP